MKRKLATLFVLLCSAFVALGFASCQIIQWQPGSDIIGQYDRYTLELDTSEYDSIVPYGGKFNYQSVKIVYKAYVGENQETFYQTKFSLTASMVTGGLDTSSVGEKELTIEYGGEQFTLPYTVKYEVDFISKGEVFDRQFVFTSDEVVVPEAKVQEGFTFAYWKSEVPEVLTGNVAIEAHYYNDALLAPALETIDCTYDPNATIAQLTLPSNENGKWEFVDSTMPVGEVGNHKFEVRFVSKTDEIAPVQNAFVQVQVAQKILSTPLVNASLIYNAEVQKATVTDVETGILPYEIVNNGGVDVGKYVVTATLKDVKNYAWKEGDGWTKADETGNVTFEYVISPKQVEFVILSETFTYNREEQFPAYQFKDAFDNAHITASDVTVTGTPQRNADTYEYGFAMSNPNYVGSYKGSFTINPKELSFLVASESFVYDGTERYPVYSFADPKDTPNVRVMSGKAQTEVGTYKYGWLIMDDNYTGMHTGTFSITKPDVTVTAVLEKTEIVYPAALPEITFVVEGFAGDEALLNITYEKPSLSVGTYVITPVVDNANVNATCVSATLTIKKGEATFYRPTLSTDGLTGTAAVYGEKISTVTFSDEGFGTWAWKDPDLIIDRMTDFSAKAVFTPQNPNLNQLEAEFFITNEYRQIDKRLLDIVVTKNEYTYTGTEFALEYHLVDTLRPESYTIDLSKLTLSGNDAETGAGEYSKTLEIVSDYYKSVANCSLIIHKADVAVTLTKGEATLKFAPDLTLANSGITLGGSALRVGDNKPVSGTYAWEEPTYKLYELTIGATTPVKVVFTPDDLANYNVGIASFNFTIIKADTTIQKSEGGNKLDLVETYTKVFDNQAYAFTATVDRAVAGDYTTFTYVYKDSNGQVVDEVIDAGRYTLTITAAETSHYNGAEATVNVVVTQATNAWSTNPYILSNSWTYKESAATINAQAVWGLSTLTIEYKNTTTGTIYQNQLPIDAQAGNYTATLCIPETSNWAGLTATVNFTIYKKSVNIPTVAFESNNTKKVAYNGNDQIPAVNGTYTNGDVDGVAYTVAYPNSTDKGTYYVTLTLKDAVNYVWNGENIATVKVAYEITTAANEITSLTITGWAYEKYDAAFNSPSITAKFGADTVKYTYYRDAGCTAEILLENLNNANVGTYYVKAFIAAAENGNYASAEKAQSFTIEAGSTTGNFTKTYEITWKNGLTLKDVQLDANYTWDAPETVLIAGSTNSYPATYKIENYEAVHGNLQVVVHKISGTVTAQEKTFTYSEYTFTLDENGTNTDLNTSLEVSTNHGIDTNGADDANEITYTISYKANESAAAQSVTTITNAGVYTVTVKLAESEHYTSATTTVTLTIHKKQNDQNILPMTATYGDDLSLAKDGNGKTLSDYNDEHGVWSWETSGAVGDAGKNTHTAIYTPKAEYAVNYAGRTVEVEITVAKKAIELPTLTTSFVYNGRAQKPDVSPNELYTIVWSNENSTNVDTYTVTLTLTSANYAWSGSGATVNGLNATYNYTITKATLTVTADTAQTVTYGDKVLEKLTLPVSTFNGNAVGTWSWNGKTADDLVGLAGTQYFEAKCTLSENEAKNFAPVNNVTVTVTVKKATPTLTVLDNCSKVYDGNAFAFADGAIKPSHNETAKISYTYKNGDQDVEGLPTDAGTYQVTVALSESANYVSVNETVTVVIEKASFTIPTITSTFTYNGNAQKSEVTPNESMYSITWKEENRTSVGTYTVTLTLTNANYKWQSAENVTNVMIEGDVATLSYTITQATEINLSTPSINGWTYGGTTSTPTATAESFVETSNIQYKYQKLVKNGVTQAIAWAAAENEVWNDVDAPNGAGTYRVKAYVAATVNYGGAESAWTQFTISPATATWSVDDGMLTYNGKVQTRVVTVKANNSTLTSGTDYTVTGNTETNAGNYTLTITLGDNYVFENGSTTATTLWKIEKAEWTGDNSSDKEQLTFTTTWKSGLTLDAITLPANYAWKNPATILIPTETAQTYPVVYTDPSGNYKPATLTNLATVQVNKATVTITATANNSPAYDVNKSYTVLDLMIVTITTESGENLTTGDFVWTWTIGSGYENTIQNAGTYSAQVALSAEKAQYYTIENTELGTASIEKAEAPKPGTITAQVNDTLFNLPTPASDYGTWKWEEPDQTFETADDYKVNATFTPNETYAANYKVYMTELDIAVGKALVNTTFTATSSVYTGENITISVVVNEKGTDDLISGYSVSVTYNGAAISMNGTSVTVQNAGTYTFTLSFSTDNQYSWNANDGTVNGNTLTKTIVIGKATNEWTTAPSIGNFENNTFTYGTMYTATAAAKFGDVTTTYYQGETALTEKPVNAGTYTVKFDVAETNNCSGLSEQITYTIKQVVVEYTGKATFELVYDTTLSTISDQLPTSNYGTWAWAEPTSTVGNASETAYNCTVKFTPNNANYAENTHTVSVKVNKAENTITSFTVSGKMYDVTPVSVNNLEATNKDGVITYAYSGTMASGNGLPTEAGTYIVTVTIAESTNYKETKATATVTITPATATLKVEGNFTYDKTEHTATVTVMANGSTLTSGYTVEGDKTATNAGPYNVTVTLGNNYVFEDNTREATASWTIAKATVEAPELKDTTLTYNGSYQLPTAGDNDLYTISITGSEVNTEVGINADTYTVKLSLNDTTNYEWSGTVQDSYTYTITPAKATLSVDSFTYDRTEHTVTVTVNALNKELTSDNYTVEGDKTATNAGSYNVTVKLTNSNYVFANGETTTNETTASWTIAKATVSFVSLEKNTFAYTGKLAALSYTVQTQDGKITLEKGTDYTIGDAATNVGTHTLTIALSDNFTFVGGSTQNLTYTITQANLTVTLTLNNYGWTYGQYNADTNTLSATANKSFEGNVTVQYRYATSNNIADVLTNFDPTTQSAGTYYVQAYVEGADNYNGAVSEWKQFTIAKANVAAPALQNTTLTYNGSNQLPVEAGNQGTYTIKINDALDSSAMGVNVGTYTVTLSLNDTTNYTWSDGSVQDKSYTYEIKPATAAWSVDGTSFTYNGSVHTVNVTVTALDKALTSDDYEVSGNIATNAGDYTLTVTLTNSNYVFENNTREATGSWTIAKATVAYEGDTSFEVTYGATFENITLPTSDYGTWAFEKTGLVGDARATAYTFTVKFTPKEEYKANYAENTQKVTVKVNKAENNITNFIVSDKTYDGSAVTYDLKATYATGATYTYSGTKANGTTASGNGFPTEAGTYTVTVTIAASTNYNAATRESNEFTITPAEATLSLDKTNVTYNGSEQTRTVTVTANGGTLASSYYTISGTTTATNAGTHTVTVTLNNQNYVFKDGEKTATASWTIAKKSIATPTLTASFTYNGKPQKPENLEGEGYTVSYENENSTDVGDYKVMFTLDDNYKWAVEFSGELTYTIKQATLTWDDLTVSVEGATELVSQQYQIGYGANYKVSVTKKESVLFDVDITPSYEGLHGTTYNSATAPTDAGIYKITFTVNSKNYAVSGDYALQLTISQIDLYKIESQVDYGTATNGYYYQNELTADKLAEIISCKALDSANNEIAGSLTDFKNLTFNGDNSYVDVTFTPTNTNYRAQTVRVTIKLKGVAYIGSTYYGTIEAALAAATSGETVYVVPDSSGNVVITEDCTIASGVTLCLPYEGTTWKNSQYGEVGSTTFADCNIGNVNKYRKSLVIMAAGVTLTVNSNANLQIGGYIGVRDYSQRPTGHTYYHYTEILMRESAKIVSYGTMNCCGYVKEAERNNGSMVEIVDGKMYMPYVIYDYRGGSDTTCVYLKGNMAPFSIYDMPNVQSFFTIHSAATLVGYADLYASGSHNATEINIIAKSGAVLNLTAGTATLKYTPETNGFTTHYEGNDSISLDKELSLKLTDGTVLTYAKGTKFNLAATDIQICGDAHLGSMSMKIMGVSVKTSSVMFPISWKQQITLRNGTYEISNPFKMLSGSIICVEEGATLNAKGSMVIYPKSSSESVYNGITTDDVYHFNNAGVIYPTKEAAQLLVKGRLNISDSSVNSGFGGFGGMVTAASENAVVNVTSSASNLTATSTESKGTVDGFSAILNPKVETIEVITKQLQFLSYNKKQAGQEEYYTSAGTYYGAQCTDGTYAWVEENETFKLSFEFGYMVNDTFRNDLDDYTIANNADVSFKYADHIYLGSAAISQKVTIDGVEYILIFKGWYTKADTMNEAYRIRDFYGKDYVRGGTLYGVFEAVSSAYTVKFDISSDETTVDDGISVDSVNIGGEYIGEFNPMSETAYAYNAINADRTKAYYLAGWYLSTDSTKTLITADNPLNSNNFVNGEVTLKALWLPKKTVSFDKNTDYALDSLAPVYLTPEQLSTFELAEYTKSIKTYNDQIEYAKYFSDWKYKGDTVTTLSEDLFDNTDSITLTAEWLDKDVLTLLTNKDDLKNEFDDKAIYLTPGTSFDLSSYKTETIANLYDNVYAVTEYFLGWYDKAEGGTKITSVDATATLYAQWGTKYMLILDSNAPDGYTFSGFEDGKFTLYLSPTQTLVLSPEQLAEQTGISGYDYDVTKGYTFSHWYLNNESIKLESLATLFDNEDSVTIYAAWAKKYTVSIDANKPDNTVSYDGGTVYLNTSQKDELLKDSTSTFFAESILNCKTDLTQSHYFDRWTYDDGSELSSGDKFDIDGTTIIKATWIRKFVVIINYSKAKNVSVNSITISKSSTKLYVVLDDTITIKATSTVEGKILTTSNIEISSNAGHSSVSEKDITGWKYASVTADAWKITQDTTITITGS